MMIVEALLFAMGIFGVGLSVIVGLGIAFYPIAAFLFWKYPRFCENVRSFSYGGSLYKEKTEEELKKFAEWAGFKDATPPTAL